MSSSVSVPPCLLPTALLTSLLSLSPSSSGNVPLLVPPPLRACSPSPSYSTPFELFIDAIGIVAAAAAGAAQVTPFLTPRSH